MFFEFQRRQDNLSKVNLSNLHDLMTAFIVTCNLIKVHAGLHIDNPAKCGRYKTNRIVEKATINFHVI